MSEKKREFLMQSQNFNPKTHRITGFFCSEKLDGMRAVWIPWTVGKTAGNLSGFVNVDKSGAEVTCSGLFSRYGRVIHAPSYVVEGLMHTFPDVCVDGELYAGRGQWNTAVSTCKKQGRQVSEKDWRANITFNLFDVPDLPRLFQQGRISNVHNKKYIKDMEIPKAFGWKERELSAYFDLRLKLLQKRVEQANIPWIQMVDFEQLAFNPSALDDLKAKLTSIVAAGGEGLMLRHPSAMWEPYRSYFLLKVKGQSDAEGKVIGYTTGNGKYQGMIGSVRLQLESGIHFDLSGFTDEERTCTVQGLPDDTFTDKPISDKFPLGSIVTFVYRELSPIGVPKEARYLRRRLEE